jgi:SAM-dependent methyltransferase
VTADPVAVSVASYERHAFEYEARNAYRAGTQARRFIASCAPGAVVLDAGCGPGRDMRRFAEAQLRPVGVDLSPTFVAMAKRYGPVVQTDLRRLPLAAGSIAAVWASASLVHLTREDAVQVLRELHRVAHRHALMYLSVKTPVEHGWRDGPIGRRWFTGWTPWPLHRALRDSGWAYTEMVPDDRFIDVWAVRLDW